MTSKNNRSTTQLALIGDSDIAYWPPDLYPVVDGCAPIVVSGHSGATLKDILPHLRTLMNEHDGNDLVIVACAGENDLGNGVALDTSVSALETFLGVVFDDAIGEDSEKKNRMNHHYVIFLGPKFEPWLEDDPSYKKKYSKMSRSFDRCFQRHSNADNIHYIDCLTMFCTGETANIPGAILGGKAKADYKYFASDRLHLSSHGYKLWKEVVERQINETMSF